MSLVRLREGERRPARDWRELLAVDGPMWDGLVAEGIFSPVSGGGGRDMLRLGFVGLVGLPERLAICMPVFDLGKADPVRWLRRVLAAYFSRAGRTSREDALLQLRHRDEAVFREVDALSTLLASFSERGLYRRAASIAARTAAGPIDWAATLSRCEPLVSAGGPLYLDPVRRGRSREAHEVGALQAAVTVSLAQRYGEEVPATLREQVGGIDLAARLSPARADADLALLARERAVTYATPDLRLLEALSAIISGRRGMAGMAGARLHGTTAFELVWEDALRDLLGHDHTVAPASADWRLFEDGAWSAPQRARGRRLDLVVRHGAAVLLADAKYHHPFPVARPGWADVVKQIYYAETIVRPSGHAVHNAFLLPLVGRRIALAGRIDVEQAGRRLPGVEAWTLDPGWVFSGYGDGDPRRRADARAALFAARDEVAEMLGDPE